ncbi:MAG: pilus assembly protein, partial [bacterium]
MDNTAGPTITNNSNPPVPPSYQYSPVGPYKDAWGDPDPTDGTLADVAMYYWNRDLRTSLANKVPTNAADPAFWQHMVSFTVGLGLSGTLDPATDLPALTTGTKTWPMPFDGAAGENLDDLWHAAVNGRGDFFSASNPDEFAQGLSASLANISDRTGAASSIALNSTSLRAGSRVYQARFKSADWSGQLLSIPILSTGALGPEEWDAAQKLAGQDYDTGRKIVTFKPSARTGAPFRWTGLEASQQIELEKNPATLLADGLGSQRLDYLRGKDVPGMRLRAKKLGDIVHSSPAFVGAPIFRYPDRWPDTGASAAPENAAPYSMFKSDNKTRKPLVYAGANDGMLHAFDADTGPTAGEEAFAYVPAAVYKNLNQLTNPTYAHRFFVDGAPTVGDAFFDGSWHTVLVGGLRAGGQAIYALDITDPPGSSDDETGIAAKVLWEFNDVEDPLASNPDYGDKDLGDTFSEPNIVRLHNGQWAAVFGNGYNNTKSDGLLTTSTTGNAVLYIVDIATGELIKKIDTGVGKAQDPKNTTAANQLPNGLATPAPIDANGDSIVDYIYAGDLFGNLWKFDVSSSNENSWQVLGPSGGPLFVACGGTGTQCTTAGASNLRQPITTRPQVGRHPTKANGFMVYFGTGKYIEGPDIDAKPTGQTTQTFYGIWDENLSSLTAFDRTKLLEQKIVKEISQGFDTSTPPDGTDDDFFDLRVTTDNPIDWDTPPSSPHRG